MPELVDEDDGGSEDDEHGQYCKMSPCLTANVVQQRGMTLVAACLRNVSPKTVLHVDLHS